MLLSTVCFCTVQKFENIGPMSCLTVQSTNMAEALESLVTFNVSILTSLDMAALLSLTVTKTKHWSPAPQLSTLKF